MIYEHPRSLLDFAHLLLLGSPDTGFWVLILIWAARIVTFGLLLRTFFIPWLLALMSDRIRIRSISLRSIRGLRVRKGAQTWSIDRVSYIYSMVDGSRRLALKIEGLSVDLAKPEDTPTPQPKRKRHARNLTLADFNPSPIARYMWSLIWTITTFLEPSFRPIFRSCLIACLRLCIQWVPKITQALSFDLHRCGVTFAAVPGACISAEHISLHMALNLIPVQTDASGSVEKDATRTDTRMIQGFGLWRKRLAEGFQRSLDTVLGETHGAANLSLKISHVSGSMPRQHDTLSVPFVASPGTIDLSIITKFRPKEGVIDTHGLSISLRAGSCSAKVDLLNQLLDKALPKKVQQAPDMIPLSPPASPSLDTPLFSGFSLASQASAIASPVYSLTSSLFSPSSIFSASGPTSAKPLVSPPSNKFLSPTSPTSPFFRAFSASMRQKRRHPVQPSARLKESKDVSKLSILNNISVSVTSITLSLSSNSPIGPYKADLQTISITVALSNRSSNHLHREYIGAQESQEAFETDIYALKVTLRHITVERDTPLQAMQLARFGSLELNTLVYQWPTPFLNPSAFIRNDPNASLLAIHLKLADVDVTDRMEDFQGLLEALASRPKKPKNLKVVEIPTQGISPPTIPVPRLAVMMECGPIAARLIYNSDHGEKHRAIELRNNGIVFTTTSEYQHPTIGITRFFPAASSVQSLHLSATSTLNIEPILVRVRLGENVSDDPLDDDFLDDPPILSIGNLEVIAKTDAIAQIDGAAEAFAIVDKSSIGVDLSVTLDTISVELWHPIAADATLRLLSLIPPVKPVQTVDPVPDATNILKPRVPFLPIGLSARVAISRLLVFITAPDISPTDSMDLSRGFSIRATLILEYASLRSNHIHWFDRPQRTQKRSRLRLMPEALPDSIVAARSGMSLGEAKSYLKLRASKLVFREAIATQFEPDDPVIAGREEPAETEQDIVRVDSVQANVSFALKTSQDRTTFAEVVDVLLQVPKVHLDFKMVHAYSVLLALQTIRLITPPRSPAPDVKPESKHLRPSLVLTIQGSISNVDGLINLPSQQLCLRIDGIQSQFCPGTTPSARWTRATVWVTLPDQSNRWEAPKAGRWDEFLSLRGWELSFTSLAGMLCIAVDGDHARLRIPHGFILANLVQDAGVAAKAFKHIAKMASAGCYSDIPYPEAEGPKSVPHLTIRLGHLCVEVEDDPFESRLGLIWQAGFSAVKQRLEREEAFEAKVAAILEAEPGLGTSSSSPDQTYEFGSRHSVTIDEARRRLDHVHALDWTLRLRQAKEEQAKLEGEILTQSVGPQIFTSKSIPSFVHLQTPSQAPPLLRLVLDDLCLIISPPSFELEQLPDVMHRYGYGLPRDTTFSLLVPLHLHFTINSLRATLRDYPLPLAYIPPSAKPTTPALTFDTDLIVGEEMGTEKSVDWVQCPIIEKHQALHGEVPFSIAVPKTIMPVKTYAAPIINVTTPNSTILSWGVSYTPAIQDLMRIVDTLTTPPRDISPGVGFWDKMRLVFHWTVKVSFSGEVLLYMKGTRDPYIVIDEGAGFALCWQGNPEIRVGYDNYQKELVQVMSDDMLIGVPNFETGRVKIDGTPNVSYDTGSQSFRKVVARLSSGVRFGLGFTFERACGPECAYCSGSAFHRQCRYFSFRPHYSVRLEIKDETPNLKSPEDSFNGFRSDFIHLSVSLTSSTKVREHKRHSTPSNLYLTPKLFAHFWSWCSLFDGALSLPVRQGNYYPSRPISPKLGRHLATLKYRISLPHLYFMHGYIDNSRETWVDGVVPWVGVKGRVDELQADMHQREEESTVPGPIPDTTRTIRRKPFYAAEVVVKGLELRALMATFSEPARQTADITAAPQRSNYRKHDDLPQVSPTSLWYDLEDFVEMDWTPPESLSLHLLPAVACPQFTYFKQSSSQSSQNQHTSKFGSEHSHSCLLGKEASVPQTQVSLAAKRVAHLKRKLDAETSKPGKLSNTSKQRSLKKMITLLDTYISMLKDVEIKPESAESNAGEHYNMPADIVSPDEWAEFENVYQIHCPSIFMDSAVRDIMMQYYYCSRDRRGFEYHLATRAVKFIRDQANAAVAIQKGDETGKETKAGNTAMMAATAIRKMLKGDGNTKLSVEVVRGKEHQSPDKIDPMDGWTEGVSLRKSHYCLLLKPQIVLRGETSLDACIIAAAQAKLQSFGIMDLANLDDPISGKVMSRNFTSLSGFQTFAPTGVVETSTDGSVPLEVLIDLRCESTAFERLVPQTEAFFHYDKFNRLRLRNNITSGANKSGARSSTESLDSHLEDQTDLIRVHIPRFTVSASTEHFQAIANIVTKLVLFSDPAHKTRTDQLQTMIFTYDFTDLASAAGVVTNLQTRLRDALETERATMRNHILLAGKDAYLGLQQLKAHIFLLSEELNLLFDAIKLAQDRFDDQSDQKSALLLHTSSSEISWRMLDERGNLLSKLVVANIDFHWLSRADSSTVNHLNIGNMTAFDGSRYALWSDILSKYDEPANHPLVKRGIFLSANWTILPPVGGISIYEVFEMSLHPVRLQLDAKVGQKMMEYIWPSRKNAVEDDQGKEKDAPNAPEIQVKSPASPTSGRSSIDSPRALYSPKRVNSTGTALMSPPISHSLDPPLRKLGSSRSFTDLRAAKESSLLSPPAMLSPIPFLRKNQSSESLNFSSLMDVPPTSGPNGHAHSEAVDKANKSANDAQVMKTRSTQKTFVLVKIASVHLLLSMVKEGSFECHDAKIKTRELEYRNQTWSFEELVGQFIPSNMNWRGWVKMAFNQPLVPVLPVARELLAKTKWKSAKSNAHDSPLQLLHPRAFALDDDRRLNTLMVEGPKRSQTMRSQREPSTERTNGAVPFTALPITEEPESMEYGDGDVPERPTRKRVRSLFSRTPRLRSRSKSKGRSKRKSEENIPLP